MCNLIPPKVWRIACLAAQGTFFMFIWVCFMCSYCSLSWSYCCFLPMKNKKWNCQNSLHSSRRYLYSTYRLYYLQCLYSNLHTDSMIVMADLVIKKKLLLTGKIKKILTIRTEPKQKLNILISKKKKRNQKFAMDDK